MPSAATLVPEPPVAELPIAKFEFDENFQRKIVNMIWRDEKFAQRTDGLIKPEYFENEIDGALIAVAAAYYAKYRKVPDKGSVALILKEAMASKKMKTYPGLKARMSQLLSATITDRDFVIDKVSEFAQERAYENAIVASVDLLAKRDFAGIKKLVDAAQLVGAAADGGDYDYFEEIESRTATRIAMAAGTIKPNGITTGFPDLDKHLYHRGWGRKELSAIMADAKFGKSMALGDFGKSAAMAGYNVFIASCEVSREIYAERLDANFSDTLMDLIRDKPIEVQKKVLAWAARPHGHLKIRDFASGSLKPSQLRRVLQEYRNEGIIFDLIEVDYADLMQAEKPSDQPREDSKSVWIDLRGIAYEENAAVLTATQTNRAGAKSMMPAATDVAEDYNKIRIADLVVAGAASEAEKDSEEARIKFIASRNQKEITLSIKQCRAKMKFISSIVGLTR
jgi:replicative DNA helicase